MAATKRKAKLPLTSVTGKTLAHMQIREDLEISEPLSAPGSGRPVTTMPTFASEDIEGASTSRPVISCPISYLDPDHNRTAATIRHLPPPGPRRDRVPTKEAPTGHRPAWLGSRKLSTVPPADHQAMSPSYVDITQAAEYEPPEVSRQQVKLAQTVPASSAGGKQPASSSSPAADDPHPSSSHVDQRDQQMPTLPVTRPRRHRLKAYSSMKPLLTEPASEDEKRIQAARASHSAEWNQLPSTSKAVDGEAEYAQAIRAKPASPKPGVKTSMQAQAIRTDVSTDSTQGRMAVSDERNVYGDLLSPRPVDCEPSLIIHKPPLSTSWTQDFIHSKNPFAVPGPPDLYVKCKTVVGLTKETFKNFLRKADASFVLFYSPTNDQCDWARNSIREASLITQRKHHVFAAVDCLKECEVCVKEGIKSVPTMKLYVRGHLVDTYKRTSFLQSSDIKALVENAPVVRGCF